MPYFPRISALGLVGAVEAELGRLSTCEPWIKQVPFLIQLPGLGVLSVMSILAAIGDITRFASREETRRVCRAGSKCA